MTKKNKSENREGGGERGLEKINKTEFIDIGAFLEEETGIKFKNLNKKKIDELLKVLEQLPPNQVLIKIEDGE